VAQPGVSIQMNFAREITRATAMIQATPKQLELASRRAIKKTIRWLQTRVAAIRFISCGWASPRWRRKRRAGHGKPSKGYLLAAASIPARSIRTCMAMALRRGSESLGPLRWGCLCRNGGGPTRGRGTVGSLNWVALGIPVPAVAFQ